MRSYVKFAGGVLLGVIGAVAAIIPTASSLAEDAAYGKPGDPIALKIGYIPAYTPAWSAAVLRKKALWQAHLPAGSTVTFDPAPAGMPIVKKLLTGAVQIGYVGDAPAIIAAFNEEADVRIVAALGSSQQQCSLVLVRADAPAMATAEEAANWLNGKETAAPQGSCADRFGRSFLRRLSIAPENYANLGPDAIGEGLTARTLDAGFVWEPLASRLVTEGAARRVASGVTIDEADAGFVLMRQDLKAARPDVVKGWLEAELEAQLFLAAPDKGEEIVDLLAEELPAYGRKALWSALYQDYPASQGGSPDRLTFSFAVTPDVGKELAAATDFLYGIKRVPAGVLRAQAVDDAAARDLLKQRGLSSPVGVVKAQPGGAK